MFGMPRIQTSKNKVFVVREMGKNIEMRFFAFLSGLGKAYGQSLLEINSRLT